MNVTLNSPGFMRVRPEHVSGDGQTMVYIEENGDSHGALLWVTPEAAAQWIEALTPLAEGKP
jgi:hypothetical protein